MMRETVLAFIPAKGNSRRLPGKNKRLMNGYSLVEWAISCTMNCFEIDHIIVNTDDQEIRDSSVAFGVEVFDRDPSLVSDSTGLYEVCRGMCETLMGQARVWDGILLLEPTGPLRRPQDVDAVIRRWRISDAECVATFHKDKPLSFHAENVDGYCKILDPSQIGKRSQDMPPLYNYNSIANVMTWSAMMRGGAQGYLAAPDRIEMYETSIMDAIDIDSEDDWEMAATLMRERLRYG